MITVILKGGLGNQMFQYAFGKSLALSKKEELVLDISFLNCRIPVKGFTVRDYELDLLSIPEKPKPPILPDPFQSYLAYPLVKITGKFTGNYLNEGGDQYAYEKPLVDRALNSRENIKIEGYWNNYRYFSEHETELKNLFDPDKLYDPKYKDLESDISESDSVSINIRRGDYLNSKHKDVFVYLDKDYYSKAIEVIRKNVQNPKFFVFSYDDPEWIKTQLNFNDSELVIVGKEFKGERFRTYLRLISLCKHNIISNSTFAFWGAYLNKNYLKVAMGPKYWTAGTPFQYPDRWFTV